MFKTIGTLAAFALLTSATWFGLNQGSTVSAWKVGNQESAYCNESNTISFDWSFTNQEPNDDKYTIDLAVTEVHSGQKTEKTVKPGETVTGSFDTDFTRVGSWRIRYEMAWTNGMTGVDQRGSIHPGLECEQPPKTTEVCRDGKVITINVNDRKDTDTDAPCPVVEEKPFQVCRDGKEIMVTESEYRSTDVKGDCPQVLGTTTPKSLPNTGAASLISVLGSTTLISGAYGLIKARKQ